MHFQLLFLSAILFTHQAKATNEHFDPDAADFTDFSHDGGHKTGHPDLSTSKDHFDSEGNHFDEFDHEAITGSRKDAAEFRELSPEESKRRLELLVDVMDLNRDGKVNRDELHHWIMNSFTKLDAESASHKFEELDKNDDKKVTWPEYVHHVYGYTEDELQRLDKDESEDMKGFASLIKDERQKFILADTKNDGALDKDEHVAFVHPQNYAHMAPYEIQRTMADFDKNKDGFIDETEFLGADVVSMSPDVLEAEKKHFQKYDLNKDGLLVKEEMIAWLMPGFNQTADSEVEHLFRETDKDKNDDLSKEEILDQVDLWVGSHATDYGRHLDEMKMKTEL